MNHRPQDDIPYEVIVKHIIEDYRRLLHNNDTLKDYARSLERKIETLNEELSLRAYKNERMHSQLVQARRERKRMQAYSAYIRGIAMSEGLTIPPPPTFDDDDT